MLSSRIIPRNLIFCCTLLLFFSLFPLHAHSSQRKNYFPLFRAIADNVAFWEKVYADFSINTAVFHDRENLSIIYEAVPLLDNSMPGASRLNRSYLKAIDKKYTAILTRLADGQKPTTIAEARVYAMFPGPGRQKKFKRAATNIRVQFGLKERFIEGVIRSGAYIDEMKRIFASYGLPEDLAYLPHVESSFNLKAYSKFGASGIWQFTRSTGRDFMTINFIIDERRDPIIATHAAAKYLKRNFDNLGTWPLAITAYNYGHAGMMRAVNQEGNYEKIFQNYRQGYFKFASRNFYSEFLAARNVAKKLEKSPAVRKNSPASYINLKLPGFTPADKLARHFKLSQETLQDLNPALRSPIWQGEKYIPKGYSLRLPSSSTMTRLAQNLPRNIWSSTQKRSKFYKVRQNDTAGSIARRFGISLNSLSKANNLNAKSTIYLGQTLQIPSHASRRSRPPQNQSEAIASHDLNSTAILKSSKKSRPEMAEHSEIKPSSRYDLAIVKTGHMNGTPYGEITVQPEESLGLYAEWLKVKRSILYTFNHLAKGASIQPGQKIKVVFTGVSQQDFERKRTLFHQEAEKDFFSSYRITGFTKYKVAMGDTLWEICQNKFDLPLWLLKKYNHSLQYNALSSNQHLNIPIVESL